jgi:dihydroceramidase
MVAVGLTGLRWALRRLPHRFAVAFGLLALVGLGSVAFHGTLRFELQMLDQLPMLYLVLLLAWILFELDPTRRPGPWFGALLGGAAAGLTVSNTALRGPSQFLAFHLTFGAAEVYCLARLWWLQRRSRDPRLRRGFRWGISAYATGIAVWFADLRACELLTAWPASHGLPRVEWHAVWHVCVSIGFGVLLRVIVGLAREAASPAPAGLPQPA